MAAKSYARDKPSRRHIRMSSLGIAGSWCSKSMRMALSGTGKGNTVELSVECQGKTQNRTMQLTG